MGFGNGPLKIEVACPHCDEVRYIDVGKRPPNHIRLTCQRGFGEFCVHLTDSACLYCGDRFRCMIEWKEKVRSSIMK